MKSRHLLNAALLLPAALLLWSCQPKDPGAPLANEPPATRLIVASMLSDTTIVDADTVIITHHPDHYVSASPMFRVQWFGYDPDGTVAGYWVKVDNGPEAYTTSGDSLISFESATPDPRDTTRMLETHTLKVAAMDNEGARDPTPATRVFQSTNMPPAITSFVATFSDGDTVGSGIAFSVNWEDPNPSGALFQLSVDGAVVAPWDTRGAWQFCQKSDAAILGRIDQGKTQAVDVSHLPAGVHALKVELKDLGGAASAPVERSVTVAGGIGPKMTSLSSTYGTSEYYPDGSIFYRAGTTTSFSLAGNASSYYGSVSNFRYRSRHRAIADLADSTRWSIWAEWSSWGGATFGMDDLPAGQYQFQAQCRDFAGAESDTLVSAITIVQPDLTGKKILIVNETKNGNGGPGSPDSLQITTFYDNILSGMTGWEIGHVYYAAQGYVSPLQTYDCNVIIWHADDKSVMNLRDDPDAVRILTEYLRGGGRLILSGWDVMGSFTAADSAEFTSGFAFTFLRCTSARRNAAKDFTGMTAAAGTGYADLDLDFTKVPTAPPRPWPGLDKCWLLNPGHRAETIGLWKSASDSVGFAGMSTCIRNLSPVNAWKTITLGFPLFFMKEDQARAFIEKAVADLTQ